MKSLLKFCLVITVSCCAALIMAAAIDLVMYLHWFTR